MREKKSFNQDFCVEDITDALVVADSGLVTEDWVGSYFMFGDFDRLTFELGVRIAKDVLGKETSNFYWEKSCYKLNLINSYGEEKFKYRLECFLENVRPVIVKHFTEAGLSDREFKRKIRSCIVDIVSMGLDNKIYSKKGLRYRMYKEWEVAQDFIDIGKRLYPEDDSIWYDKNQIDF